MPVFQRSRVIHIQVMPSEEVTEETDIRNREMWSEFKAKSSRDNARANDFETSNQER